MKFKLLTILGLTFFFFSSCQQNNEAASNTKADKQSSGSSKANSQASNSKPSADKMSTEEAKEYRQLLEYQEDLRIELKNTWENVSLNDLNNDGINEMVCYNSAGFKLNKLDGRRYKVPDFKSGAQIFQIVKSGEYKKIGKVNSTFICEQGINWQMKTDNRKKEKGVFQAFDLEICQDDTAFKTNLAKKHKLPEGDNIDSYKKVRLFHTYTYNLDQEEYQLSKTFLDFLDKNNRGTRKTIK